MKTRELKKDIYWNGIMDRELRVFDIIMETEFGTTYNSYLVRGSEKTAIFETAKLKFYDEYLEALTQLTDVSDIDYIIVNHTEPDHAGSVEKLIDLNPNIKIVGTAVAISFLKNITNRDFYSITVKENDTLSLGNKTLTFMMLPNLHWPDTMYTYLEEDKILFTCDSFGSHYCLDDILLSELKEEENYLSALKYYFDNILGPFKPFMLKALNRIENLEFDMICTGHGPVIDCRIDEIKELYKKWCTVVNPNKKKTVIIPYVSAYGYTKELAGKIADGIMESGDIEVRSYDLVEADIQKVTEEIGFADGILFGTPTILGEALKPIWDLTTEMFPVIHGKKLASAFGSYGWSGEGVPHILERLKQIRLHVTEGFKVKLKPGRNDLIEAYEYGFNFGCVLQNKENPRKKSAAKTLVKCVVCGEIFEEGVEICPVCGVGKENFVPVVVEDTDFKKNSEEIFLILGNGAAGISAAKAIRERNETASIVMVSKEGVLSYNRPMLTKSMLAEFNPKEIAIYDEIWYKEQNILNVLEKTAVQIDIQNKEVHFADGMKLKYHKLIYALGAECFIPPISGHDRPEVIAIRNLEDTIKVSKLLPFVKNAVVIGGGVLGLEAAWEISKSKCCVTVLEAEDKLMGKQLDVSTSKLLEKIINNKKIGIRLNANITSIEGDNKLSGVKLENGEVIPADLVIISCGIRSNIRIAKEAGITVDGAVLVNEKMETNVPGIYACGDCAKYDGINYGIWPQALEMGKVAGANAAGDNLSYETVSAATSFNGMDTSLYALGDTGKREGQYYKTVELNDPQKNCCERYYFSNNRLCGAILVGDTKKVAKVTKDVENHTQFKDLFQ